MNVLLALLCLGVADAPDVAHCEVSLAQDGGNAYVLVPGEESSLLVWIDVKKRDLRVASRFGLKLATIGPSGQPNRLYGCAFGKDPHRSGVFSLDIRAKTYSQIYNEPRQAEMCAVGVGRDSFVFASSTKLHTSIWGDVRYSDYVIRGLHPPSRASRLAMPGTYYSVTQIVVRKDEIALLWQQNSGPDRLVHVGIAGVQRLSVGEGASSVGFGRGSEILVSNYLTSEGGSSALKSYRGSGPSAIGTIPGMVQAIAYSPSMGIYLAGSIDYAAETVSLYARKPKSGRWKRIWHKGIQPLWEKFRTSRSNAIGPKLGGNGGLAQDIRNAFADAASPKGATSARVDLPEE